MVYNIEADLKSIEKTATGRILFINTNDVVVLSLKVTDQIEINMATNKLFAIVNGESMYVFTVIGLIDIDGKPYTALPQPNFDVNDYILKVREVYEYLNSTLFVSCCTDLGTLSVRSYPDLASFPATGVADVIYIAEDTNYLYRWDGAAYVQVGGSSGGGFVPYTGATGDVDLGTHGITSDFFQANLTPTNALQVGRMRWNDTDGTMDLRLKGNNVTLQIGQEQVARVVNKTTPLIDLLEANYQVVLVAGATGQRLSVRLAQGDNDANSAGTLGIVTETILKNQEGFITVSGQVKEINTTGSLQGETWVDGQVLYLSPTTAGAITNVKPTAPQHSVIVGYVEYAHAVHGKIFVKVDNGYELDELHNVLISSPSTGQTLLYDSVLGVWSNENVPNVDPAFISVTETSARLDNWAPTGWPGTVDKIKVIQLNANYTDKVQIISGLSSGVSGRIVTLSNTSTDNLVILESNSTNSLAANRLKFLGRGAYFLFPGDDITFIYNGTQWSQLSGSLKNGFTLFDDFGGPNNTGTTPNQSYLGEAGYGQSSGTGSLVRNENALLNSMGTIGLITGTTATGYATVKMNGRSGVGVFGSTTTTLTQFAVVSRFALGTLPTVAQDYRFQSGLCANSNANSVSLTGLMGWYCSSANANWKCYTSTTIGSLVSDTVSGLVVSTNPVVLGTYHPNILGDTVFFYSSDGGMTYTVDSRFVRVSNVYGGAPVVGIGKTVGTTSVTVDADYIGLTVKGTRI